MKKYFSLIFIIFITNFTVAVGETLRTISVEFKRELVEGKSKETVEGSIYYKLLNKVILKVTHPISQWMVLKDNELLIYYPDKRKAFIVISKRSPSLAFFQAFIGAMRGDYGLTELGYTMTRHEKKGNTLFTYWSPPEKKKNRIGEFVLGTVEGRIVYLESKDPEGKTVAKCLFKKHVEFGGSYFPLEISITKYTKRGLISEKILYTNPKFNESFPQEIIHFKLPPNIKVKEIEW